jgi:hypothetical protein
VFALAGKRAHDGIGYFEVVASRKPGETKR